MENSYDHLPEIDGEEAMYIQKLFEGFSQEQAAKFASIYRNRRKDPQMVLITCLLGFFLVAGIHRLILNQIGMGILYIFTGGLCLIGTVVDLINYKDLAFEYNRGIAMEVRNIIS